MTRNEYFIANGKVLTRFADVVRKNLGFDSSRSLTRSATSFEFTDQADRPEDLIGTDLVHQVGTTWQFIKPEWGIADKDGVVRFRYSGLLKKVMEGVVTLDSSIPGIQALNVTELALSFDLPSGPGSLSVSRDAFGTVSATYSSQTHFVEINKPFNDRNDVTTYSHVFDGTRQISRFIQQFDVTGDPRRAGSEPIENLLPGSTDPIVQVLLKTDMVDPNTHRITAKFIDSRPNVGTQKIWKGLNLALTEKPVSLNWDQLGVGGLSATDPIDQPLTSAGNVTLRIEL